MERCVITRRGLLSRGSLGAASMALPFIRSARAADAVHIRCSLDTAPSHLRNVTVAAYLKALEARSGGRITTELFSSGQLFPDLDVAKALVQGQVEMACPGAWTLTGFIPDADLFQLPAMYGQPIEVVNRVIDGAAGAAVAGKIEQRLKAHVLGKWLDLGYQNWYSATRPLHSLADLKGMKIRNPGGAGLAWRTRFWGGIPNTTAWPNVPLALSQGTFDGLISTDESLASAKLWEAGVKSSLADHQFVGVYIPMLSGIFWNGLAPDLQALMSGLWAENIATYRANMQAAQVHARDILIGHGVAITDPTPEAILDARKRMVAEQDAVAKLLKISPEVVRQVAQDALG